MRRVKKGKANEARLQLDDYDGRRALYTDGVVHSIAVGNGHDVPGYWPTMLPDRAPGRALLLGLGGGTLAHLLARRYPSAEILGVDNDEELLAFAREHFDLALPTLRVVVADAFAFVWTCTEQFDYIAVDLFAGHAFQRRALARPFLTRLRALAAPGATLAVNLFRDEHATGHVARLRRVLPIQRVLRLRNNVVVHALLDDPGRARAS
ncbi:MAG: trans-aconitate 2-methyltransferase [Candidatus Methylomirabilales bacterium]